jgi:lactoylglutathione lyase
MSEPDPSATGVLFSHVGICVTDLERSMRFYCEGLGFRPDRALHVDDRFAEAMEVRGPVDVTAQYLCRENVVVELLAFTSPRPHGAASASRGQVGLTHLSFLVEDMAETVRRLTALGGTVIESTRLSYETGTGPSSLVFLADPDGTRVELLKRG